MEKLTSPEEGIIIIEDNGDGMDLDLILNVWLELASDFKTKKVQDSVTTSKGRLPIGEKGIGRLGVHKLGNKIELITKKSNSKEVHVKIDWREFEKGGYLEDIPVKVIEKGEPEHFLNGSKGTYISITDFKKKTKWTRGKFRDILRTITSFTSPFEETNESFKPSIEILDNKEWLEDIITWEDIKDYAIIKFEVEIEGEEITKFYYKYEPYSVFEKAKGRTVRYGEFINENGDTEFLDDKLVSANKTMLEDTKRSEPIELKIQ